MSARTFAAVLLVAASLLSVACERPADRTDTTADPAQAPLAALTAEYGEPVKTYTVRGEVERLPDPELAGTNFVVHHEAIDDFVGQDGKVVGMHSMSMPFPLADGVALPDGLAPGSKVLIHCAQWIKPRMRFITYRVDRLPDETELTFRRANPPQDAAGEPTAPD